MSQMWIGWDPREAAAFMVARSSLQRHIPRHWSARGLMLSDLRARGLYVRPTERRDGRLWDVISGAAMSTEHANARFLVPHLSRDELGRGAGWVGFMDGDMLVRAPLAPMIAQLDKRFAVYCVQHTHDPTGTVKMDNQVQARYHRKNWSSFMIFNTDHPANRQLTPEMVNMLPGRDLHRLCWLDDDEVGALDQSWNYLVGHTDPSVEPSVVHWTDGVPDMPGYEDAEYADEWRAELARAVR